MSEAQLVLQVGAVGAKLSKEPKRCSPGHKSLSPCTVDVLEGGLSNRDPVCTREATNCG
ncbi:hypothetical protein KIN20_010382 [Parelaphostrongylus tenuis]|uniref:Uncharacterized protein n=1 Tax=Parelaphostrongylus tenuis TaxID=148309 RepID=A0AAD5MQL0_PARTN|nr:hypothetical protein KIN20_010382 [Parelaphostrongylus tenuis]